MKAIFQIIGHDLRATTRSFFAMAIIIAISVLPALYAWFNIYANHDPYGSTGNIRIAVASRDEGLTLDSGEYVNMAESVFDELRESDSIAWQFPDSADEAIEGVRAGDYYAAIVFESNFTYNMYHFEQALSDSESPVTYYENAKKNAVASKITETAASTLQQSINTKYLQTVFQTIFTEANDLSEKLESGDAADAVLEQLVALRDMLDAYDDAVEQFTANSDAVRASLSGAQTALQRVSLPSGTNLTEAQLKLAQAQQTVAALSTGFDEKLSGVQARIDALESALAALSDSGARDALAERIADAQEKNQALLAELQTLRALLPESEKLPGAQSAIAALDTMIARAQNLDALLSALPADADPEAISQAAQSANEICAALRALSTGTLAPGLESMLSSLTATLKSLAPLLNTVTGLLGDMSTVAGAASGTVGDLDNALGQLRTMFQSASGKLTEVIDTVAGAEDDQRVELLIRLLGGDAELYGRFFSSLVDVEVEEIYPVASYGAAMTPFYSVLAVWVGGVILVSILDTHADEKKFPNATEAQRYFGRFGLFFLVGQLQAAVIVVGDIYLLGCAPVHPWLLWIAAAVASLTFVLLIYSLTISFGDVGKAIVVVVMVVQIAGSSGSYPIEILPEIFAKIYRFFPFPYAINAMREAICGVYGHDYLQYLGELLLFAALAVFIGLVVRRPFLGVNHFVSEKLEETEVI